MKVLLLSDLNSTHTIKWATSLVGYNIKVCIVGLSKCTHNIYEKYENISTYSLGVNTNTIAGDESSYAKIKYAFLFLKVKQLIRLFSPDIVHAHYATSYGLLGVLTGFHPLVISVWGTDIFSFPKKSFLHKNLIQYLFKRADKILSTSKSMLIETEKYTNKNIEITPFGVDITKFFKADVDSLFKKEDIVIGIVKSLEDVYGIEFLISAFSLLKERKHNNIKLLIVGGGSQEKKLKKLVQDLKITNDTVFAGFIPNNEVPKYYNMISIAAVTSKEESFGVSAVEAMACEIPIVVTNVGGLKEVVINNKTGLVVPPEDPTSIANAIEKLLLNKSLSKKLGNSGREHVIKNYSLDQSIKNMLNIYNELLNI